MKEYKPKRGKEREIGERRDVLAFPARLNKFLAHEGRGSRREVDRLIAAGKVYVNGQKAVLGTKVNEGDKVEINSGKSGKEYPKI